MLTKNPNRGSAPAMAVNSPAVAAGVQLSTGALFDMLKDARKAIAQLEARLQRMESAVYVAPNGDVEISSATTIRIACGLKVEIVCDQAIELTGGSVKLVDNNGNALRLEPSGMTQEAAATLRVTASSLQTDASMVQTNSGMSRFSGVVQCDTIIANSVVGSSYTPGAGNVW